MDAFDAKKESIFVFLHFFNEVILCQANTKSKKKSYFNYFKPFIYFECVFLTLSIQNTT